MNDDIVLQPPVVQSEQPAFVATIPVSAIPDRDTSRWALVLAALVIVAQLAFVLHFSEPAITSPDANGYWAQATNLVHTGRTWFRQENDAQYVGMHWLLTDDGRYFSRYPPGLAVLIAGAYAIDGARAAVWFDPLFATLTLLGFLLLLRQYLSDWASLAALLLMAINPVFNLHAQYHYSHMAVMCMLVWGFYFLARWSKSNGLLNLFCAGVLLGAIPTIRYPEAIFAAGIAVFILWDIRSRPRPWLQLAVAGAAAAVPIVPLLIHNQLAFGAFHKTAYVLTNEQSGFGWGYFKDHFTGYIRSLNADGMGLLFGLGIVGIAAMCLARETRRIGVLLALTAIPSTMLYMFYYWGMGLNNGNGGNMRYLLPTFFCYAFAGVWFVTTSLKDKPVYFRGGVVGSLLLAQFFWGGWTSIPEYVRTSHQKKVLALTTEKLIQVAKPGDVLIADNQILQDLDFINLWRLADDGLLSGRGPGGRFMMNERDPNEPSPMQSKKMKLFQEKYGSMSAEQRETALASAIKTWSSGAKIYYVGAESALDELGGHEFAKSQFKIVQKIPLPPMPEGANDGGGFGGMRRGGNRGNFRGGRNGPGGGGGGGNFPRGGNPQNFPPPGMPPPGGGGPGGPGGWGPPGGPGGFGRMGPDVTEYVIAEWHPEAAAIAEKKATDEFK